MELEQQHIYIYVLYFIDISRYGYAVSMLDGNVSIPLTLATG